MKTLLIGGSFNDVGGRTSGYIVKLHDAIEALGFDTRCHNGGSFETLQLIADDVVRHYDVVLWFADVPNDKKKVVSQIKKRNPQCCLVTSKRNEFDGDGNRRYSFQEIMRHALQLKSNLVVQFWHILADNNAAAEVFDPLGNRFMAPSIDIQELARVLMDRCTQLRRFTRTASRSIGDRQPTPDQPEFFALIRQYADVFHQLLQPSETSRFLGNASFRCARGFPSFRADNTIYVSRRNVDKRYIGPEAFVAVDADVLDPVQYYGDDKPSVDTPIQLRLYRYYRRINYMLHGHVYVVGGVDVGTEPIPCGAVEEALQLCRFARDETTLTINIRHHGCLILGTDIDAFKDLQFKQRPMPEEVE